MNLQSFVRFYRDIITLCIALFLSSILLFSNDSIIVDKLQSDIADIYSIITYPQRWYRDILSIKEQNNILIKQLTQIQLLYSQNEHFRIENEKLKAMIDFSLNEPWSLVPSYVTNRHSMSFQSLIIDVGEDRNISKNQPVINMHGLVGKTISVGSFASKVQLLIDKNYRVSIRIGEKQSLGIFIPTHGKFGILEGVRKSMELNVGEIAYTSGISEIYPANIPVARVISVSKDNNQAFQDVNVEILVDLENIQYTFVIQ